jgi:hypothetical protein
LLGNPTTQLIEPPGPYQWSLLLLLNVACLAEKY